jgi:hypothetical protein
MNNLFHSHPISPHPRRPGRSLGQLPRPLLAAGLALLLTACGGGGGSADNTPANQPPLGEDGRAQTLAVSQPGELLSSVRERLRERAQAASGTPGAMWNPGRAALLPMLGSEDGAAGLGLVSATGSLVQEAGVDEADLMKTDGEYIYALRPAQPLRVGSSAGLFGPLQVDVQRRLGSARLQPLSEILLPEDSRLDAEQGGLVLSEDGSSLAVLTRVSTSSGGQYCNDQGTCLTPLDDPLLPLHDAQVSVQRMDLTNKSAARAGTRVVMDGQLLATRRVGNALYVVTLHQPRLAWDTLPATATDAEREAALTSLTAADLLPTARVDNGNVKPLVAETDCWLQRTNASLAVEITTVTVFDLASPTLAYRSRCFSGGAEAVYVSADNLYLASTRNAYVASNQVRMQYPAAMNTDIHKFSLANGDVTYRGSAQVPGHLGWDWQRKSLRLSEWNGDLRVLTFTGTEGWAQLNDALTVVDTPSPSPATLTVLRENPAARELVTVSTLPNAQRPEPLGKPGEQVYAVRFVGTRGYLVTFRTVDPLYVLDLSNPADPLVLGELQVPGFSDHLFPLNERLLLGVGRDVVEGNQLGGVKFSVFDVGQPTQPVELASAVLGQAGSISALDASRHGLNLKMVDGAARVALPLLEAGVPWGDWHDGLQRFEVDLSTGQMGKLDMLGRRESPGGVDISHQRGLVGAEEVFYLRDDGLSAYTW